MNCPCTRWNSNLESKCCPNCALKCGHTYRQRSILLTLRNMLLKSSLSPFNVPECKTDIEPIQPQIPVSNCVSNYAQICFHICITFAIQMFESWRRWWHCPRTFAPEQFTTELMFLTPCEARLAPLRYQFVHRWWGVGQTFDNLS